MLETDKTGSVVYVENGNNIDLDSIAYITNPSLFLSVNGSKSGNIKLSNTLVPNQDNQIKFTHGANASMISKSDDK